MIRILLMLAILLVPVVATADVKWIDATVNENGEALEWFIQEGPYADPVPALVLKGTTSAEPGTKLALFFLKAADEADAIDTVETYISKATVPSLWGAFKKQYAAQRVMIDDPRLPRQWRNEAFVLDDGTFMFMDSADTYSDATDVVVVNASTNTVIGCKRLVGAPVDPRPAGRKR